MPTQAQYGGGTGGPNDPYLIYTAEQMNTIGAEPNDWDKHFKLMADIDLSAYTGTDFNIIGYYVDWRDHKLFTGVFDGNGHTISNFSYTSTDRDHVGLFGYVEGEDAEIKDLGLIDPNVDAGTGDCVGSLVGRIGVGTITNCYAEGASVAGNNYVGGLVGENGQDSTITNCYSTGSVIGNEAVGGLVGEKHGPVTNCYAAATVTGINDVGGLVGGHCCGTTSDCYAMGTVVGDKCVGGLVGSGSSQLGGIVSNCYSAANVAGTTVVGGLIGKKSKYNTPGVMYSFWDIETSGQSTSAGGRGKTTAEMQDPNTFMDAGWDFFGAPDGPHDIWAEPADEGYPTLCWQLSPPPPLPTFSGGTGEPNEPYLISTAADLNSIGHNPKLMAAHFKLTNDIDLAGIDFFMIGNEAFPFTGVFDGNGHDILNSCVRLFGYVNDPKAEIKDLRLIEPTMRISVGSLNSGTITNCHVEGGSASLVERSSGTIINCTSSANVSTGDSGHHNFGGLVAVNSGRIINCHLSGDVSGRRWIGGLVGTNLGIIINCSSSGSVPGGTDVGGLVGVNRGIISNSYSSGDVSGSGYNTGGLSGSNRGIITNCYATGSVTEKSVEIMPFCGTGGLSGSNSGTITNCYSVGSVTGMMNVGGLVGLWHFGAIEESFWDIESSGQTFSDGGRGRTTAEIQTASTFLEAGWDFVDESDNGSEDIWDIFEGVDYPKLSWELTISADHPDYNEWVELGEPICWRYRRQCHGDADCKSQGKQKYWVSTNDLDILIAAWNKPFAEIDGKTVDNVPLICADFDHKAQGIEDYRVSSDDLDILIANWNTADKPDPNCP
jgi:hypothetical protein